MAKFIKRKHSSDDNETEGKCSKAAKHCDKLPKARPKRQYCDDYLKYGFHWTSSEDQPFPLCHLRYGAQQVKWTFILQPNTRSFKIKI